VLRALSYTLHINDKYDLAWLWAELCGNVFYKAPWNPKAGGKRTVVDPDTGEEKEITLGDVDAAVLGPFGIYPDPAGTDYTGDEGTPIAWLIEEYVEDVAVLRDRYGVPVKAEDVSQVKTASGIVSKAGLGWQTNSNGKWDHHATVREMWVRPCPDYPRGRLIICTKSQLLQVWGDEQGECLPYANDDPNTGETKYEIPYEHFPLIHVPGQLWGATTMEDCVKPQWYINKVMSHIMEIAQTMGIPQLMAPKGSVDWEKHVIDETVEVIEYNAVMGSAPTPIQKPGVPPFWFKLLDTVLVHMQQICGIHDVSRGQAPSDVKSGVALSILAEQDDSKFGPAIRRHHSVMGRFYSQILRRVKQYYTEPRTLKYVGNGRVEQVMDFVGSSLTSTDVVCNTGQAMPPTQAARMAWLRDLQAMGFINPENPKHRDLAFRIMELGDTQDPNDDIDSARSQQQAENRRMGMGEQQEAHSWELHAVHLEELNKWRGSSDYEEAVNANPAIGEMAEAHAQAHRDLQMQDVLEQVKAQALPEVAGKIIAEQTAMSLLGPPPPDPSQMPPEGPPMPPEGMQLPPGMTLPGDLGM
jgi:hypothetical protein